MNNEYFGSILAIGLDYMKEMQEMEKTWKARIQKQWKESQNFPRKKKKAVRKNLRLEWLIACWNPFEN